jgi:hypothetical protein
MKVERSCYLCHKEKPSVKSIATAEVTENPYLEFKCSRGHKYTSVPMNPVYELLYDHALDAYQQENYYECYLSTQACLEQFRQQFVLTYAWVQNNHVDLSKQFRKSQGLRLSERSTGAFIALCVILFQDDSVPTLTELNDVVNRRNRVVHGDVVPGQEDCKNLLVAVYHAVFYCSIKYHNKDGYPYMALRQREQASKNVKALNENNSIASFGSIMTLTVLQVTNETKELDNYARSGITAILQRHDHFHRFR